MSSSYFHRWEIVISRQFRLKWHDWPLFYLWHSWYSPFFLIQPVTAVEWVSNHLVYHMSYNMDWSLKQSWVERESVKSLPCRMGCAPDNGGLSCRISRQVALKRLCTMFFTEKISALAQFISLQCSAIFSTERSKWTPTALKRPADQLYKASKGCRSLKLHWKDHLHARGTVLGNSCCNVPKSDNHLNPSA